MLFDREKQNGSNAKFLGMVIEGYGSAMAYIIASGPHGHPISTSLRPQAHLVMEINCQVRGQAQEVGRAMDGRQDGCPWVA